MLHVTVAFGLLISSFLCCLIANAIAVMYACIFTSNSLMGKLIGTSDLKNRDPTFYEIGTLGSQNRDPSKKL